MKQLNIYSELGYIEDPLYLQLKTINKDQDLIIDGITVSKNHLGIFEIATDEIHECYKDISECYNKINTLLCPL